MKAHNHSQLVTWPPWSSADSHHMSCYQYFIIISFQKVCFQSAIICTVPLHFAHTPYTLKILHFKFIFSLSNLFHSFLHLIKFCYFTATLLTYKNPCILPYKNNKSLQFSSPISVRLILHSHFGILDYLTSVHVSRVIFWPYRRPYGHSAPLYIVVQWLWFTHTSDTASSSTICPWFLALLFYTSCVASIWLHCSLSRPGFRNPFTLATAPQCEVLHCTVSTQHSV